MSLDKVLALAGAAPAPPDPDAVLLLAAQAAASRLAVLLAKDDDEDDDGGKGGDSEGGGDHSGHATYKALVKRDVPPKRAAAMCAKSDRKVAASQLAESLAVILSGRAGLDVGLVTLTPGTPGLKHLHSAAVLAAGDGKAQREVRARARELGVNPGTLPGFGLSDEGGEQAADTMIALAAKAAGDGGIPMNHGSFTGTHTHTHFQSGAHAHPHQHAGDSHHDGGPLHRPGSKPMRNW
jgi:hypothetical protein